MLRDHYKITLAKARVYTVRMRGPRRHWGWATATIREWPRGGQIDVQSDFGNYAYAWGSIGNMPLRKFLTELDFDYFMNKSAKGYRVFDEDASRRRIKAEIFDSLRRGDIDRATAHEWRDELDDIDCCGSEQVFADRVMACDFFYKLWDDYPSLVMRDSAQARAFWDGPWKALCGHWKAEIAAELVEA